MSLVLRCLSPATTATPRCITTPDTRARWSAPARLPMVCPSVSNSSVIRCAKIFPLRRLTWSRPARVVTRNPPPSKTLLVLTRLLDEIFPTEIRFHASARFLGHSPRFPALRLGCRRSRAQLSRYTLKVQSRDFTRIRDVDRQNRRSRLHVRDKTRTAHPREKGLRQGGRHGLL